MEQLAEQAQDEAIGLGEDWRIVEALLPDRWMEMARQLGAFQRARGIADARSLLQVMLIHLGEGCGLRETAARASLAGIAQVSDVALLKRLRSCGPWFEWLAQQLRAAQPQPEAQGLLAGRQLRVVDGSVVREPGVTGSQWRLHYAIGLPGLQCQEVHLGPSDDGETLRRFAVHTGDIFIADRGYAHPGGIAHVRRHGGDVIVRMNLVTLPLTHPGTGKPLDVLAQVRGLQAGQSGSWPACLKVKAERGGQRAQEIAGRLCAVRKSAAAAAMGRNRVRRESMRGQNKVRPQTLEAAEYVLVFTTLEPAISAEQVMTLYRMRWQIELEFKRLKSLIQLGHLKKHDARAARSWLQGKLLVALLIARLIAHAERVSPWGYEISWFEAHPRALPVA
ncbi:IS4 family transposase [Ramlibacter sp. WS9]|uniref:IS4 family transposase n=1 Tax=Ramlibacter sp. WS9 TaxID=1882741 RepID=UPI001141EE1B|nr:IS4 family transposase [Ramlibacter sp. WS9]ROZ58452.1 IS4 family transposase [Ramlibacter sp. WS9]